ncbi:MAG: DUF5678 domain-containing protein [Promethearchaeota archaeon]
MGFGLDEKKLTEDAKKLMENKKWLDDNYEKLKDEFNNKYVAVEDKGIIDSDENLHGLIERLKHLKKNMNQIIIEPIYPEDLKLLL